MSMIPSPASLTPRTMCVPGSGKRETASLISVPGITQSFTRVSHAGKSQWPRLGQCCQADKQQTESPEKLRAVRAALYCSGRREVAPRRRKQERAGGGGGGAGGGRGGRGGGTRELA